MSRKIFFVEDEMFPIPALPGRVLLCPPGWRSGVPPGGYAARIPFY